MCLKVYEDFFSHLFIEILFSRTFPGNVCLFKVRRRSTKKCELCSKLTIKTPKRLIDVVLVSFFSTLNLFHTFFWDFYFRLRTCVCFLGFAHKILLRLVKIPLTSYRNHKCLLKSALSQEIYLFQRLESVGTYQKLFLPIQLTSAYYTINIGVLYN